MILRKAYEGESSISYQCIEDARAYHSSLGFVQWHPVYPTLKTIEEDITNGIGFVFVEDETLAQNILDAYAKQEDGEEEQ